MADHNPTMGAVSPTLKPDYPMYRSPFGPRYAIRQNIHGWTLKSAIRLGTSLGAFGGVAGLFALFYLSGVPRVRRDILEKLPIIGEHYVNEIPASDNPF